MRHAPSDSLESKHKAAIVDLLSNTPEPFSRAQFDPGHVTASAFVVSPNRDKLLLIFHGKLHRWLQPGGHVELTDDDIVGAATREVEEETNIPKSQLTLFNPPILDVDVHQIPPNPKKSEPAHGHFDIRVLFVAETELAFAGSDAKALKWVKFEDVQHCETDESVLRAVRKLRQRLS